MSSSSGSEKGAPVERGERNGVRGGGGGGRQAPAGGEEIASKTLTIQSKRFYLDVKQNNRGRFVKLAEVALNGRKNRLFMSMKVCKTLKEVLDKLEKDGHTSAEPKEEGGDKSANGSMIHTETIINDKRRYYVDVRENQRGTFLRITQFEIQSGNRNSIALPLEGVAPFRDALEELLDEYSEGFLEDEVDLPESQSFRTDGKNFFFDPGHNNRGDFLKITELKQSIGVRNTIALSVKAIPQFTSMLNKVYEDFQSLRAIKAIEGNPQDNIVDGQQQPSAESAGR